MIRCSCPKCNAVYTLDDDHAGRKCRCAECDTAFICPKRTPASEPRRVRRITWIAGIAVILVAAGAAHLFHTTARPATPPARKPAFVPQPGPLGKSLTSLIETGGLAVAQAQVYG